MSRKFKWIAEDANGSQFVFAKKPKLAKEWGSWLCNAKCRSGEAERVPKELQLDLGPDWKVSRRKVVSKVKQHVVLSVALKPKKEKLPRCREFHIGELYMRGDGRFMVITSVRGEWIGYEYVFGDRNGADRTFHINSLTAVTCKKVELP